MQLCLINEPKCGRVAGTPVCPKCGMDEHVVYPDEADRVAAQAAALTLYQATEAAGKAEKANNPSPEPATSTPSPKALLPELQGAAQVQPEPAQRPTTKNAMPFVAAGVVLAAVLGGGWWWEAQHDDKLMQAQAQAQAQAAASAAEQARMIIESQKQLAKISKQAEQAKSESDAAKKRAEEADAARLAQEAKAAQLAKDLAQAQTQSVQAAQQPPGPSRKPFEPVMVRIPGGSFTMGSAESELGRKAREGPQREVQISQFELGKYEVTFAQWDACVADGGCSHRPEDKGWGRGKRPVMNVSWDLITQQYIPWLNRKTGNQYRLPSEAEWEYAARAGCETAFNVGGECAVKIEASEANFRGSTAYNGSSEGGFLQRTAAVGSYTANRFGLYDMHGNVSEFVQDCTNENYNGAPIDGRAWMSGNCGRRMIRGGSWYFVPQSLRSASRDNGDVDGYGAIVGFRLARSVQ